MFWIIFLVIVAVLVMWLISIYNRLVTLRNQVKNSWAQIDVQLQRRYDLIPNLVESVKGYMAHEKGTLEAVIQARNQAAEARKNVEKGEGTIHELAGAETMLGGALSRFFALSENYPDLKASTNMMQLQEELSSTENKVAFSRQAYNDQVLYYNTYQEQFPAVLFAGAFGHKNAEMFEVEDAGVKKAPEVKF